MEIASCPCRVCFTYNVKMHNVINTPLQELYEKLTNVKLIKYWSDVSQASTLCSMCFAHLQRCYAFQQAATRAEDLLAQLCLDRITFTKDLISMVDRPSIHNYATTPVEYINIYCGTEAQEKQPVKEELELQKDEHSTDDERSESAEEPSLERLVVKYESDQSESYATDSDEDLPLHVLRTTAKNKEQGKKTRDYNKPKLDAREVLLTYEQQKEAMSSRASSLNYLNSPHRCTLCYRGFTNIEAYDNHMEKHAEDNGDDVCELCFMRYRNARLLRAHTHASHSRQYVCNKCGHVSNTRHQASDHQRIHTGDYYECKLCGRNFHARTSYLTHMRCAHPGGAKLVCAACGERFLSEHGLRMHRARAHTRPPAAEEKTSSPESRFCSLCDIQFASRRAWATHVLTTPTHRQLASDTNECPICVKSISSCMNVHLCGHERELKRPRSKPSAPGPTLQCDQCELSFATRARLAAHVRRIHLGVKYDKNLVCELCGKKCTSGATLRYHQRTHTGERPHACAVPACGKRFADTNQLRIHTRTHTGERPYSCDHCGRRFAQKPALNRHYRVHTGVKPYTCELCTKSFSQSNSLNTHVKAVHLKLSAKKRRTCARKTDSDEKTTPPDSELPSKLDLGE